MGIYYQPPPPFVGGLAPLVARKLPAVRLIASTAQTGYPTSDVAAGSWLPNTGTDLFATVDETVADDTDYDYTLYAGQTMKLALTPATDGVSSVDHVYVFRASSNAGRQLRADIYFGGVFIATRTISPPSQEMDHVITLTGTEADLITDYSTPQVWLTGL